MKIIQWVYTVYAALLFTLFMLTLGWFVVIPYALSPKGGKIAFIAIRIWIRTWSTLVGIRYRIHGKEHININQPYIYIFNHRSFIDAPVIPMAISQEVKAIGKKELSRIPIFGIIASRLAVWVDRKDALSRKKSVKALLEILQTGISIVVAPEGTRNNSSHALLPFQKGAFRIAIETGIHIMPMAIIGADKVMKRGSILLKPGVINIYFSNAIDPTSFQTNQDVIGLAEKCFNRLEAMILTHE
ncbi:1-acyl-sn-glycerol-3-phosphate acyltransferase [Belliella sp. DSM 111904]|uniref:1-acyl-sn-glycerol-3-phosphate acyltransferase n=1 Tax=Belliella filtrata TaxID=2923435 RepID=A0ABS9UXS8_9BACT|nr:lysophospholipid acyltransferase family protein [Belliella filtrata]MCH7408997.1 1-acyl-sn-glycerol-3-phosphate acyltransferase [Belliella filtrata]